MNSRQSTKLDDELQEKSIVLSEKKSQSGSPVSAGKTSRLSASRSNKTPTRSSKLASRTPLSRKESIKQEEPKIDKRKFLLTKFKAYVNAYCFVDYFCKYYYHKLKKNLEKYTSFALIMNHSSENAYRISNETLIKAEMMNFKHAFREQTENNEFHIDNFTKTVLKKSNRSFKEVEYLKKTFKHWSQLKSINQLTEVMQNKYYQNCRLDEFEQNRVISLQENPALYFYILIKGSLVCTYKKRNEIRSHTICFIEKGGTYGDLPLLSNSNHTSTLIARTNVQLLVIDNDVFIDIFVNQNQNNKLNQQYLFDLLNKKAKQNHYLHLDERLSKIKIDEKNNIEASLDDEKIKNKQISLDDLRYLKEMTFLKSWPINLFIEEANSVRSVVFNREQLITSDSNSSKYIYVIKTGSISVLVTINKNNIDSIEDNDVPVIQEIDNKKNLNEAGYFPKNVLLDDHHQEVLFHEGMLKKRTDEEIKKDIESKMRLNEVMTYLASMKKLDAESNRDPSPGSKDNETQHHDNETQHHHVRGGVADVKHLIHMDSDDADSLPEIDDEDVEKNKLDGSSWIDFALKKVTHANKDALINPAIKMFKSKLKKNNEDPNVKTGKKIEFSNNLDIKKGSIENRRMSKIKPKIALETLENKKEPIPIEEEDNQYLFVQKLFPGDHFGLADLLFDKQPSLQLVSNGCECILISKEFFVQNSNLEYLKRLKKQEAPYPRIEQIEQNYKLYLSWRNYSNRVLKKCLVRCT